MTGVELASIRKAAGLSQTKLAQRAGIGRHAVSYWECKPQVDRRAWAVDRIAEVLPLPALPVAVIAQRTSVDVRAIMAARHDAIILEMLRLVEARMRHIAANRRVRCGARTRKGTACLKESEPGKRRCRFHGGKSTGAKTAEGKARIAEAQKLRWAKWRADRRNFLPGTP